MVNMNVIRGVISGKTAKEVSPTRPRVTLCRASRLIGSLRYGAMYISTRSVKEYMAQMLGAQ